jgi:hypothetical protein
MQQNQRGEFNTAARSTAKKISNASDLYELTNFKSEVDYVQTEKSFKVQNRDF